MTKISSLEAELRCFWDASNELHRIRRENGSAISLLAILEELEMIGKYSDWPTLKKLCDNTVEQTKADFVNKAVSCA